MWRFKIKLVIKRIWRFLKHWPRRVIRLALHTWYPMRRLINAERAHTSYPEYQFRFWLLGWFFLVLDIFGVTDFYDVVASLIKRNVRPLNPKERKEAESIFFDTVDLDLVMIDQKAQIGTRKFKVIYVSFYTINSWGQISMPIMIHELVHVWQYEQFGGAYIALALQAQFSAEKYDYGGQTNLVKMQGQRFELAFNFEQQAEIIEDFYRSKRGLDLQWSQSGTVTNHWLAYWAKVRLTA